jgi:chromosome segregation ATPase
MRHSKIPYIVLLMLAMAAVSFWSGRTSSLSTGDRERLVLLHRENSELKAALEELRSSNATLEDRARAALELAEKPKTAVQSKRELSSIDDIGTISAFRESLALANKTIDELQVRSTEQQAQLDQLRKDHARLAAIETDLNQRLASATKLGETKDAELSRKTEEVLQLEAVNGRLREAAASASSKARPSVQASNELQEIYRRRESYLNTLFSRYREITEQYRAFVSVLENRRGPEGTPGGSMSVAGPELSRIQSGIAMAEEDLRQLNSLNAQALRLQKKLAGN